MKTNFKSSCFLVLILFFIDSQGRFVSDWSITKDSSIVDECLRKSIRYINRESNTESKVRDASNIVLKAQINNGLNFILTFDLSEQRWECTLYKSMVEILNIKLEQCTRIAKENIQSNNDDAEGKIDALNKETKHNNDNNLRLDADRKDSNENNDQVETNNDQQPKPNSNDNNQVEINKDQQPKSNSNDNNVQENNQEEKDDEDQNERQQNNDTEQANIPEQNNNNQEKDDEDQNEPQQNNDREQADIPEQDNNNNNNQEKDDED